ncbi:MAG: hypothetical protein CVU48_07450 [Candidatus Cloacimonetes bacterium HGW-Cloacimonetes-1]|jgi:AcrR family transcriptional regulator|nr:MAG: hypothetical protein CVU48_07450 [Candidatus Cloacimonetes bacterium HGW-Cloacimonetes-1]
MKQDTETKLNIIQAASKVFIERGMDGARMQDIADLAGINKALLHYYYNSKEELYRLVATREIKQAFAELLAVIPEEQDFRDWIRSFIHNYLQVITKNPQVTRFMLWEISQGGNGISAIIREFINRKDSGRMSVFETIRKAMSGPGVRQVDPIHFFMSLIGMCVYPFLARPILENVMGIDMGTEEFVREREEAVYEMVLYGMEVRNAL